MNRKSGLPLTLCLLLSTFLRAQSPAANADILKMIQAGLPEGVIVDKITAGTGHWDTSVDALIALKNAGATPAEMKALTAPLASAPASATSAPAAPLVVADGIVLRTKAGDPYIKFPERVSTIFPNYEPSNIARLIAYEGKPAILLQAEHVGDEYGWSDNIGNLVITRDSVFFNAYIRGWGPPIYIKHTEANPSKGDEKTIANYAKYVQADNFSMPRSAVTLRYVSFIPHTREIIFGKKYSVFNVGWVMHINTSNGQLVGCDNEACSSPQLEAFLRDLINDFDTTMANLLMVAGISDVDKQLSNAAHFTPVTPDEFPKYCRTYASLRARMPPPTETSGGFLAGLGTVLQVASAGATALQQTQAGGGTIAAQAAAKAQYDQSVAAIMNGTNTSAAPAQTAAVSAADSTGSSSSVPSGLPSSGTAYTGPYASWVHMVLGTAGPYSCSPIKAPAHPASFTCQRDGEVYKAQQLAWASECSAATGHPDDAVKDASVLMDTLRSAKSLCGAQAPTGAVVCDTDRVLSCSQLP